MKVYLLFYYDYEDTVLDGVYATPELAMAAHDDHEKPHEWVVTGDEDGVRRWGHRGPESRWHHGGALRHTWCSNGIEEWEVTDGRAP